MQLQGCYTALVTPFKNGAVDYDSLAHLVDLQLAGNVSGIVPVGTSGECPTLTVEEHLKVIEFVTQRVNHRCQIIAGTGANSTAEAIKLSKAVVSMGVDATLQVTPYYNKPSGEGLYRHFSAIAEASGLPVVLYNVPGRTGKEIPLDIIERLSHNPLMVAVKEAGGSVERVNAIRGICNITVLSGDDSLALPMMAVGATGVISVSSNVFPAKVQEMCQLALANDFAAARKIHDFWYPMNKALFIETNPVPVKAALALMGLIENTLRPPLAPLDDEKALRLLNELKHLALV